MPDDTLAQCEEEGCSRPFYMECPVCDRPMCDEHTLPNACLGCDREVCVGCGRIRGNGDTLCPDCVGVRCVTCNRFFGVARGEGVVCAYCSHNLCSDCERVVSDGDVVCDTHYAECEACGASWVGYGSDSGLCQSCEREGDESQYIHPYSYKPTPHFIGTDTHGCYFGLEIEVELRPTMTRGAEFLYRKSERRNAAEGRYYLKEDCSVQGYEIVTHPGSKEAWHAGHVIDWDAWTEYVNAYHPACQDGDNNGLHVHVSRRAFYRDGRLDAAHTWRFTQLVYHNADEWQQVAGRRNSHYADWDDVGRYRSKAHEYVKGEDFPPRHTPINFENGATIELRFLKPHSLPSVLLGRIDVIAAAIDYTRRMTYKGVTRGGLGWGKFAAWLTRHAAEYPYAASVMPQREGR